MKILALDMSTKRTGYAYRDNDKIIYGAISASSTKVEARIIKMRDEIIQLIKDNNIEKIVVEEVRPDESGYNNHTSKVLLWLQGCVAVAIHENKIKAEIEYIGPSSWRKQLRIAQGRGVKREVQKQNDIAYVNSNTDIELKNSQDDEADAICILLANEKMAAFSSFLQ